MAGVTLRTWQAESGVYSRCCDIDDARRTSVQLGIPYYNINSLSCFERYVTGPFVQTYISGQTPNPCVYCNRYVKWEGLLNFADEINAEFIATGHYARVVKTKEGRYTLEQANCAAKDQTYMLYRLTQNQLKRTLMPLADLTKEEVRRIAGDAGLVIADRHDSQELCFVTDGSYTDYIDSHADEGLPPPGSFTDEKGRVLGVHKGIVHYTVGQRKGLGLSLGYPGYVKEIDADNNRVVIGDISSVRVNEILTCDNCFMSIEDIGPEEILPAIVRIRYHHKGSPALISRVDKDTLRVSFKEAVMAPAPGQSAVFYDRDRRVIGGGIIRKERP